MTSTFCKNTSAARLSMRPAVAYVVKVRNYPDVNEEIMVILNWVPTLLSQKKCCAFNYETHQKRYDGLWSGNVCYNPRFKTDPGDFPLRL